MPKRVAAVVVILVIGIVALVGYLYWTRTPQYALRRAADAVEEHDLATFQKYVDSERLTSRFVDDMLASVTEEASKETFGGLAVGMVMMMRPQLVKTANDALERAVETGKFEQSGSEKEAPVDVAKPYWKRATQSESGFRRISYVKTQGKIAIAGLELYDADLKMPFTVELKLRDVGSHWQIIEVANIRALQKTIREGTEKRLNQLNAPIRSQMVRTIEVVRVSGWSSVDSWGFDRKAIAKVRLRNVSSRPVTNVTVSIAFMSGNILVGRMKCAYQGHISPGEADESSWSRDINQFDKADMLLFEAIDVAQPIAEIQSIQFEDGTSVELLTTVGRRSVTPSAG